MRPGAEATRSENPPGLEGTPAALAVGGGAETPKESPRQGPLRPPAFRHPPRVLRSPPSLESAVAFLSPGLRIFLSSA